MSKKFLYIIEADLKSGAGQCAVELLQQIKKNKNYSPIVITQFSNDLNNWCNQNNIENYSTHYARTCSFGMGLLGWLIALIARPLLNYFSFRKISKKVKFQEIAFIHSNAISIDFGAYLQKKTSIPHIWHVRDFLIFNKYWRSIIPNLPSYVNTHANKILTVSKALSEYLQKNGCSSSKVQSIYDGITHPKQMRLSFQKNFSDKIKIICLGAYCENKGQITLLEAITKIPFSIREHLQFDFWGNDFHNTQKKLEQFILVNNLQHCAHIKGATTSPQALLLNYDIGIQPSHSEGFSRVTAEYMAAGLCVIAAQEGAIPELIENNINGLMYEDYNHKELASLIEFCYKNPQIIQRLGKAAHEKALNEFCIENNFKNIIYVYDEISLK